LQIDPCYTGVLAPMTPGAPRLVVQQLDMTQIRRRLQGRRPCRNVGLQTGLKAS
jgi:hypothetical protein